MLLHGHVYTAPAGLRGFDTDFMLQPSVAAAFYAQGYRFCVRYVRRCDAHLYDAANERPQKCDLTADEVVLVLEGDARRGPAAGRHGHVRTVHAAGSGDDAIVEEVRAQSAVLDGGIVVVTADRLLRRRVEALGATCRNPGWLLDRLARRQAGDGGRAP